MREIDWIPTVPVKLNRSMSGSFVDRYSRKLVAVGEYTQDGYMIVTAEENKSYVFPNASRALVELCNCTVG